MSWLAKNKHNAQQLTSEARACTVLDAGAAVNRICGRSARPRPALVPMLLQSQETSQAAPHWLPQAEQQGRAEGKSGGRISFD
jgi:hypothetical protein